ncbi:hypothetical protein [Amycolatopsis aidingensis]|uniref:hypothetical protein n=1 Tax=Amycolatopsis aidingensis TaxID=2842453 RepID=UPI001C0C289D|nr:hypothetical protein [Amycolatopsis aidingensis]
MAQQQEREERAEEQGTVPQPGPRPRRWSRDLLAKILLWAVIAAPALFAVLEVARSPKLNSVDYWVVLGMTTSDGALQVDKLFELYHEHPVLLVAVLFWLDAKLFDGTNQPLGVLSLLLAGAMLAALWRMLPARLTGNARLAVIGALSALVFSSAATEYFGFGMMGVQWLIALAPAVTALAFAHHGRTIPAILFAGIASLGHGVAFPVWIALAVVAWLRRDGRWRILLPLGIGVAVFAVWRLVPQQVGYAQAGIAGPDTHLGAALTTFGQIWSYSSVDLALLTGALVIGAYGVLSARSVRERLGTAAPGTMSSAEDAGWVGLVVHLVLASIMIGISRGGMANNGGLAPRYAGIALLGAAALVVLLSGRGPRAIRARMVPVALVIALVTYAVGSTSASAARSRYPDQPVLAVAMRVDATSVISELYGYPNLNERLRRMSVYPFTEDFTLGCGGPELDDRIDMASVPALPEVSPDRKTMGAVDEDAVVGDRQLNGWAIIEGRRADCVLVVDGSGTVVGGGTVGVPRQDVTTFTNASGRSGFRAVAAPDVENGTVLVMKDGKTYRVALAGKPPE